MHFEWFSNLQLVVESNLTDLLVLVLQSPNGISGLYTLSDHPLSMWALTLKKTMHVQNA